RGESGRRRLERKEGSRLRRPLEKPNRGLSISSRSDFGGNREPLELTPGTGWAKAQEATRLTQLPHFQHKSEEEIGPGSYNHKDFIELAREKPCSNVGMLSSGGVRFSEMVGNYFPGPGNYGKGGNPYAEMEEKAWDRSHTKGIMCTKSKKALELSTEGSGLSPGTYCFKSGVEELLTRTISKRGPYDVFSGDRSMPIAYGHYATQKKKQFELFSFKSFVDELNSRWRKKHGVFGKLSRSPAVPTERIYCSTLSQWPIRQCNLGPGSYNPKPMPGYELSNQHPFGSSSKRVDLKSYQNFVGNTNPVGVGRYNSTKHEARNAQRRYRSLYLSKPNRYPLRQLGLSDLPRVTQLVSVKCLRLDLNSGPPDFKAGLYPLCHLAALNLILLYLRY
uniref:Lymphocyte expansion molecule n=1 Tax=Vombatus ursinus TaxID=29139 RepID=A0A4X2KHQ2_VOMUR